MLSDHFSTFVFYLSGNSFPSLLFFSALIRCLNIRVHQNLILWLSLSSLGDHLQNISYCIYLLHRTKIEGKQTNKQKNPTALLETFHLQKNIKYFPRISEWKVIRRISLSSSFSRCKHNFLKDAQLPRS